MNDRPTPSSRVKGSSITIIVFGTVAATPKQCERISAHQVSSTIIVVAGWALLLCWSHTARTDAYTSCAKARSSVTACSLTLLVPPKSKDVTTCIIPVPLQARLQTTKGVVNFFWSIHERSVSLSKQHRNVSWFRPPTSPQQQEDHNTVFHFFKTLGEISAFGSLSLPPFSLS